MRLAAAAIASTLLCHGCSVTNGSAAWQPLFDGASLDGLTLTNYGGEGEITVVDGELRLAPGNPLTGFHLEDWRPTSGYEIEVTAARLDGQDFFCGLTFPVGTDHLTLVLGGWGGTISGISNLDGVDASSNDTRRVRHFQTGRYYQVRIRLVDRQLQVTIDGKPFLAVALSDRQLSLRAEMDPCRPLGFACFQTEAAVQSLRWRPLSVGDS